MTEITIHGRGGQGGVTLAKLIATAYFLRDQHVQAFGVYAAERSGAPIQAFVRIDGAEITNHNQVRTPDHVIVLDRTLIAPNVVMGMKPDGWIILNTPETPESFDSVFPGRHVACVDATKIAVAHGLGTRTVPIVNTTIFGAVAQVFQLSLSEVERSLAEIRLKGANLEAAREAFEAVATAKLPGAMTQPVVPASPQRIASLLDDEPSAPPQIRTGSWATRQPGRHQLTPPCNHVCPAGNDVRGFIEATAHTDYDEALRILLETSPLPGVCGRVCPAPCMESCNRQFHDEAINVRELERYAADHGTRPSPTSPWREESVAVIGSGPAGLSATYALARLGYRVELVDANTELGGLLRTGIPTYRLPREVLDGEIQHILDHGVTTKLDHRVDRAELLRFTHEHTAVLIATGLQELQSLELGGPPNVVVQGIDFLERVRMGRDRLEGLHVVVVGGGNTAIDAARSARRIGARTVRIVYRRTRTEMPAIREEVDEALEEGIVLDELVAPLHLRRNGAGSLLTCMRMKLGDPDESGRRKPIPETTEDAQFDLACDRVILALGQSADTGILPAGSDVRDGDVSLGLTTAPVFTCGDFASNDGTVAAAIGSGRRAAWHVHRTLTGEDLFPPPKQPVAGPDVVVGHLFRHAPREHGESLSAAARRYSFAEVRMGLVDVPGFELAADEARRCFSCGVCNGCDRCVDHCPDGIMVRNGSEYRFDASYCKGCGVCAAECPRGVIYMAEL